MTYAGHKRHSAVGDHNVCVDYSKLDFIHTRVILLSTVLCLFILIGSSNGKRRELLEIFNIHVHEGNCNKQCIAMRSAIDSRKS